MLNAGLTLEVVLSAGVVRAARLRSGRPVALCRTMIGRPADDLPAAFGRLYALCGRAHAIAARFAIDAARGREVGAATRQAAVRALAAERVGEHLRSTFTTAAALGLPAEPAERDALRAAFAATRPGSGPAAAGHRAGRARPGGSGAFAGKLGRADAGGGRAAGGGAGAGGRAVGGG